MIKGITQIDSPTRDSITPIMRSNILLISMMLALSMSMCYAKKNRRQEGISKDVNNKLLSSMKSIDSLNSSPDPLPKNTIRGAVNDLPSIDTKRSVDNNIKLSSHTIIDKKNTNTMSSIKNNDDMGIRNVQMSVINDSKMQGLKMDKKGLMTHGSMGKIQDTISRSTIGSIHPINRMNNDAARINSIISSDRASSSQRDAFKILDHKILDHK